jgi:hypothetical protein
MTIASSVILVGGTTSSTGGTSTPFIDKGSSGSGERKLILDDGSDYIDSTIVSLSIKDPVANNGAPNGYTQQRSSIKAVVPLELANGNRTTNTVTIQFSCDPETTDAQKAALIELGAQLLIQSDMESFWKQQSLS